MRTLLLRADGSPSHRANHGNTKRKICMLGDFAVGKTSLVRRFVYDMFDDSYISTIGVKVSRKPLVVVSDDRAVDLTMMLWDLAVARNSSQMRSAYLAAPPALLVYDRPDPETLPVWVITAPGAPDNCRRGFVVLANKVDLVPCSITASRLVPILDGKALADTLGAAFVTTSALSGLNVEDAFRQLGQRVVRQSDRDDGSDRCGLIAGQSAGCLVVADCSFTVTAVVDPDGLLQPVRNWIDVSAGRRAGTDRQRGRPDAVFAGQQPAVLRFGRTDAGRAIYLRLVVVAADRPPKRRRPVLRLRGMCPSWRQPAAVDAKPQRAVAGTAKPCRNSSRPEGEQR